MKAILKCSILFFILYQLLFFKTNLMAECNEQDQSDDCRPVRLFICYLSNFKTSDNDRMVLRDDIIKAVKDLNTAINNCKYPSNDDDPQRFDIARLSIVPFDIPSYEKDDFYKILQGPYSIDMNLMIGIISTSSGGCPAESYYSCPTGENSGWWGHVNYNAMKGQHSLAHELGHGMGCDHAPTDDQQCTRPDVLYNHGYRFNYYGDDGITDNLRGTIMSYVSPAPWRLLLFSNPEIWYQNESDPDKVSIGSTGTSNCSRCINESKLHLRNLCTTYVDLTLEPNPIPEGYNGEVIFAWEMADAFAQQCLSTSEYGYVINEDAKVQFRAGKKIHIKSGFHAKSGCLFKAFINDGSTRSLF